MILIDIVQFVNVYQFFIYVCIHAQYQSISYTYICAYQFVYVYQFYICVSIIFINQYQKQYMCVSICICVSILYVCIHMQYINQYTYIPIC